MINKGKQTGGISPTYQKITLLTQKLCPQWPVTTNIYSSVFLNHPQPFQICRQSFLPNLLACLEVRILIMVALGLVPWQETKSNAWLGRRASILWSRAHWPRQLFLHLSSSLPWPSEEVPTPPPPPVVLTTLWVLANTHQLQFFTKVLFLPFRPPTVPNDQMILAQHPEKGAEFIAA